MTDFVYTQAPGKIENFFNKLRELGIPSQVSVKWLKSIGFTSSNDTTLLKVLEFLGFVDSQKTPTDLWTQYRGKNYREVLAQAILQSYSELFSVYPDANEKSVDELVDFFRTRTQSGDAVVRKTATTFLFLCTIADFQKTHAETSDASLLQGQKAESTPKPNEKEVEKKTYSLDPSVHIDIQIHIPPDATPEQLEAIFKNMSKYLFDRDIN